MLSHIVAASENNVIGKEGKLPWHLPNDFKYFKNKTWSMPVVMGRNTYESLKKELPGRINIVVTKRTDFHPPNIFVSHSIEDALDKAKETGAKEIFVIGGGEIFKQTMDKIDRIYITRVHTTIEGDTMYPQIDPLKWQKKNEQSFPADQKNNYPYTFEVWEKIEKI